MSNNVGDFVSHMLSLVKREHFARVPPLVAKNLFCHAVEMVEIETFSFCNRQCWFCPNKFLDRHSKNEYLPESLYLKILHELSSIDYNKRISFSRYNEPLSDRIILKRIAQAHEILPHAILHTNTNGDYLTQEYLCCLYDVGLRSLFIQVYSLSESFDDENILSSMKEKIDALGLDHKVTRCEPHIWYEERLNYKDMNIIIYGRNFMKNGCNRGGSLKHLPSLERISPCLQPFSSIYIDYNGSVMPCCNFRSDNSDMQKFIMGNIAEDTIFDIYTNDKYIYLREALFLYGKKNIKPCDMCTFGLLPCTRKYFEQTKNNLPSCVSVYQSER